MRRRYGTIILLIIAFALVFGMYNGVHPADIRAQIAQSTQRLEDDLNNFVKQASQPIIQEKTITKNPTDSTQATSQDKQKTPEIAVMSNFVFSNTYYYQFTDKTPSNIRKVFEEAIKEYNNTGIVNLVPGNATNEQNGITFSIYKKNEKVNPNTIELGSGGPKIMYRANDPAKAAITHSHANINTNYPESASISVALHELGHALGLQHSTDKNSIMYPTDQQVTHLSKADINGLKAIYSNSTN
ncbi:matrixin family metalloprotease [Companilactobacillus mishanensis]|uniref:Matrixin family metalloprotease n=1 Tax=Companilactobacillus mishanensis TaxID=2486008 RepID=A0A5P0ZI57_9LACO|nr:matrixin family metalloprotease [Companilactobacillus mishanensis]MQS46092.1 matrixin family metalloprotease [Companilactobacillus mishanensis]MQS52761.1 matrixin family metalloprotease [Companilactobacillus mishanensis]